MDRSGLGGFADFFIDAAVGLGEGVSQGKSAETGENVLSLLVSFLDDEVEGAGGFASALEAARGNPNISVRPAP